MFYKILLLVFVLNFALPIKAQNPNIGQISGSTHFFQKSINHFQSNIPSINLNQLDANTNVNNLSADERAFLQKTFSTPIQVSIEILGLLTALHQEYLRLEHTLGKEEVLRRITERRSKHEIKIEIKGVGKAELNALGFGKNAVIFTKVVHNATSRTYNFVPPELDTAFIEEQLRRNDLNNNERSFFQELRQQKKYYVARQVILAGRKQSKYQPLIAHPDNERTKQEVLNDLKNMSAEKKWETFWDLSTEKANTKLQGRDTTFIFYKHSYFNKERFKRPNSKLSLEYWKNYWAAIYEKPNRADVNMGIYSAGIQVGVSYLLGGPEIALLSAIWGSILGVYGKTYVNWLTANDSIKSKAVKSWFISMSFSYAYVALSQSFYALVAPSIDTFLLHLKYWSINFANNLAKVHFQQIPFLRKVHGESLGTQKLSRYDFPKAVFESQNAYLVLYTFKIADMVDFSVRIPGIDYDVKLGKLLLWWSIPFMEYVSLRYAEKQEYREAKQMRQIWNSRKAFSIPYIMTLHEGVRHVLNKMGVPYKGNSFYYLDALYQQLIQNYKTSETNHNIKDRLSKLRIAYWDLRTAIHNSIEMNPVKIMQNNIHRYSLRKEEIIRQNDRRRSRMCRNLFL